MKKFIGVLMTLALSVIFVSCSIIDDAEPDYNFGETISEPVFLYGTWDECTSEGVLLDDATEKEVYHLTFKSDRSMTMRIVGYGVEKRNETYYYSCAGTPEKGGIYMDTKPNSLENAARFEFINGLLKMEKVYYRKR